MRMHDETKLTGTKQAITNHNSIHISLELSLILSLKFGERTQP